MTDNAQKKSSLPDPPDDRLSKANEELTRKLLQSQEQAEESEQRYHDQQNANSLLLKKQELLRSLASQLVLTEQRERKRLSGELHDYLAQMLVLGRLRIGEAQSRLAAFDPWLEKFLADIDHIFSKSLTYTRTLMAELTPPLLDELGLPSALQWLGAHVLKYGLQVEVNISQFDVPLTKEQGVLLYQSVRELLLNVVKHAKTAQASLAVSVEDGDRLRIVVKDAGSGFDCASQDGKSDMHFGLASIRERLEAMEGWVTVDSAPGRGTTVTLGVPLKPSITVESMHAAAAMRAAPRVKPIEQASARHRVLLVDDHAMVRQGLRRLLEEYGDLMIIGEASNGIEAVSLAAHLRPDIILMDINMPEMNGIEATKQIKAGQPSTIVIGLSVNNSLEILEAMKQAGAASFVSKDEAAEELHDTIAAMAA